MWVEEIRTSVEKCCLETEQTGKKSHVPYIVTSFYEMVLSNVKAPKKIFTQINRGVAN